MKEQRKYKKVIDIIFQKTEVARFICRKIYNWFLHAEITSEVESNIIEPMAQLMIAENYEVKAAVRALISSEHFYDQTFRGCMINHPADFIFKMLNTFEVALPVDPIQKYEFNLIFYRYLSSLDMSIFYHPTVAGWKAFYQAPQYTKIWINSVSLPIRQDVSDRFINGFSRKGFKVELNVLDFVTQLDNPTDPNDMINELATILFAQPITEKQLIALKAIILPGIQDYNWTVEYGDYLAGDNSLESTIKNKLQKLIKEMLRMPEFYLV